MKEYVIHGKRLIWDITKEVGLYTDWSPRNPVGFQTTNYDKLIDIIKISSLEATINYARKMRIECERQLNFNYGFDLIPERFKKGLQNSIEFMKLLEETLGGDFQID